MGASVRVMFIGIGHRSEKPPPVVVTVGVRTGQRKVFGEAATSLEKFFQTYDVLLTPVMRIPPYKIGWHDPRQNFEMLLARVLNEVCYTPLHNAVGTPAMSVPLSWTKDGLPIGSQFAAWRGGEATLLQLAYELEAAQPWAKKRPVVFAV